MPDAEKEMSLEELDAQIAELQQRRENYSKVQEVRRLLEALQDLNIEAQIREAIDLISLAADNLRAQIEGAGRKSGPGRPRRNAGKPRLLTPVNRALKENGPLSFAELMKSKAVKTYTTRNPISEERFNNFLDDAVTSGKLKFSGNKYHPV